ncbi:UNVERIFIED_CONTAM: hypothetical protein Scaly_0877700 [Sesamum calycinum]|uniref:Uncharacterized protein n=1 Tax=Sesamum calycinum TaxID=2727403 RepID=A0AAW2QW26_9LAMI
MEYAEMAQLYSLIVTVGELHLIDYVLEMVMGGGTKEYRIMVEYIDHSGHARYALAEAPNEALPNKCRPSFGAAWLTKDKFKVNETYECWYTLGISKVNINHEGLFNCQAEDPTTAEMLKRYSILRMMEEFCINLLRLLPEVFGGVRSPEVGYRLTSGLGIRGTSLGLAQRSMWQT